MGWLHIFLVSGWLFIDFMISYFVEPRSITIWLSILSRTSGTSLFNVFTGVVNIITSALRDFLHQMVLFHLPIPLPRHLWHYWRTSTPLIWKTAFSHAVVTPATHLSSLLPQLLFFRFCIFWLQITNYRLLIIVLKFQIYIYRNISNV